MGQFLIEFKRGTLTMAVLSQLKTPQYEVNPIIGPM